MKKDVRNTYFKQGEGLMSGRPLPVNEAGKVVDISFVNCEFHPNCGDVEFINCDFNGCQGTDYLNISSIKSNVLPAIGSYEVHLFSATSGMEIGNFRLPRIPVKGDFIVVPTHPEFEVVKVILWTRGESPMVGVVHS